MSSMSPDVSESFNSIELGNVISKMATRGQQNLIAVEFRPQRPQRRKKPDMFWS